ncbi:hypothetical protein EGW08_019908, partial [Elysia chlorotica]
SLNYGAIGVELGQQIAYGFDYLGSKHDKTGTLRNWWQDEDRSKFMEKKRCLADQYSAFRYDSVGLNVNGVLTQYENLADSGGLKDSFRAYKKLVAEKGEASRLPGLGLTNDQLFFLGYAQIRCEKVTDEAAKIVLLNHVRTLGRFRILGPLQNSVDFAQAYQCPAGSPMNPRKKCSVW